MTQNLPPIIGYHNKDRLTAPAKNITAKLQPFFNKKVTITTQFPLYPIHQIISIWQLTCIGYPNDHTYKLSMHSYNVLNLLLPQL